MTPDDIFMLWVTNEITFDGYIFVMDAIYPVAATSARTPLPTLADGAPTWFAMLAAEATTTDYTFAA